MHCLKCWEEITEKTAVYTKSCHHVFCEKCSSAAFKKELSCPLCDTVLPKDGIGSVILLPDSNDINKAASRVYGFQPEQMCEVLKLGLHFWAKQKHNESLMHERELSATHRRMAELEDKNAKLTRALNEERLKRNSVQNEKEALQKTVSDLEARYAQKARSMRKLTELYNELRQVHRRLEVDLRGVRDANDFEVDAVPGSEFEVNTFGVSGNMSVGDGKGSYRANDEEVERSARGPEIARDRRRTSRDYNDRDAVDRDEGSNSAAKRMSTPGDVLFNFATNRSPSTSIKISVPAKNVGSRGARRRRYHIDPRPEIEEENSHRDRRV